MPDRPSIHDSDAITRTKTAVVLDLADGRQVELTAHVASARDSGLRGMEPREAKSATQRALQAGPATLVFRDLDAEGADPIGLLPVDCSFDITPPDGWRRMDDDEVSQRIITDTSIVGPVFEHDSGEAWLQIERKFQDGQRVWRVYIEAGTPRLGIHPVSESVDPNAPVSTVAEQMMTGYTHDVPGDDDG